MNTHAPGAHLPSCSGPTNCSEYASLGSMTPTEFVAWLAADRAHWHAAAPASRHRVAQLRIAIDSARYAPPNPYTKGIDALRVDLITDRERAAITHAADARSPTDYSAPDPYRAALILHKLRESEGENR